MDAPINADVRGNSVFVSRWMPSIDPPPFWRSALKQDGLVDRWQVCQFLLPSAVMIDVGVAPANSGATIENHDQGVRGMVVDFMTPATEGSHHYSWGMVRNFDLEDTGFTARFKRQQGGVFSEDKEILEAQQVAIEANPDLKLAAYRIDEGGVRSRQIITRAIRRENSDK